jgi:hypothetical protein
MKLLKDIQKGLKAHHVIVGIGAFVLLIVLLQYSRNKSSVMDTMSSNERMAGVNPQKVWASHSSTSTAQPADPQGQNEQFARVNGVSGVTQGLPPSCSAGNVPDPSELLPKDQNNEWARLNPVGGHDVMNVNLLKAGYHSGIDTVGSTLRNANLQLRSEPPNPTAKVSPWLNSTIEPDLMRVPLEIGCGPQ